MNCYVYRSNRKPDMYLYLGARDDFNVVPETLMKMFGKPEFALEFELTPRRKLVIAEATEVIRQINDQGYFLQLPPANRLSI